MPQRGIKLTSVQLHLFWGTLIQDAIPTELPRLRQGSGYYLKERLFQNIRLNKPTHNDIVAAQARVGRDLPQQQPLRQKQDPRLVRLVLLEADLVADLAAELVERLEADPIGQGDASDSSRLSASDLVVAGLEQVLRHLEAELLSLFVFLTFLLIF